ncbi:hypothetical protein LE181_03225 [Streptomyces sp. SCA3-4]|uniref:hypothetical protein n=1 Tax=Streptomyces sichuanensis TaxID=2871810 RepID=UPI001CE386ED|nr:hypothetical protein [Streptomyces sichuanensis]MCA6091180.1 hypothetical protein [Streptomyces sichuanensis]
MRTTRFPTVPFVLGLALTAVAVAGPASASAPVSASAPATVPAGEVVLTNKDHGRTVTVNSGDVVTVRLAGIRVPGATWVWGNPVTGDFWVLLPTGSSASPDGGVTADFRAGEAGTTTVDTYSRCVPDGGRVCAQVIVPWKVTVVVK